MISPVPFGADRRSIRRASRGCVLLPVPLSALVSHRVLVQAPRGTDLLSGCLPLPRTAQIRPRSLLRSEESVAAVLSPVRLTPEEDDRIVVSKKGLVELQRGAEEPARENERLRRECRAPPTPAGPREPERPSERAESLSRLPCWVPLVHPRTKVPSAAWHPSTAARGTSLKAILDPPPSVVEVVIDGPDDAAVDAAFLAEAEVGVTPSPDAIEEHAVVSWSLDTSPIA